MNQLDQLPIPLLQWYRENARVLPWRSDPTPYHVWVSEIMLQQTRVAAVLDYYRRFMEALPTVADLAAVEEDRLMKLWQGLGYNRRALALKRAADQCAAEHAGRLPETAEGLQALPGIGPATAAGVMAFAHNRPAVYVETNVRTVFIHCLFPGRDRVADREIVPLVADTCPEDDPRSWYYALLDYGAHLKQEVANPSRRSAHHTRQSAFEGSRRQKRAEVLRVVLAEPGIPLDDAHARLNAFEAAGGRGSVDRALFESIVDDLVSEGFFRRDGQTLTA
mgnify:CR=1 FL=1